MSDDDLGLPDIPGGLARDVAAVKPQPSLADLAERGGITHENLVSIGKAAAPPIPGWNDTSHEDLTRRMQMSAGENAGEFLGDAVPAAVSAAAPPAVGKTIAALVRTLPKAVSIPGLAAGALIAGGGTQAGDAQDHPAQPDALMVLRAQQAEIERKMDAQAEIMRLHPPKPRRQDDPRGPANSMSDPQYFGAERIFNQLKQQNDTITDQIRDELATRARRDQEATNARLAHEKDVAEGNARAEAAKPAPDSWEAWFRDNGPNLGYLVGGLLGMGKGGYNAYKFGKAQRAATERANALIPPQTGGRGQGQVQKLNQFYTEGGGQRPFETQTGEIPPYSTNPNPTPSDQLYPKRATVQKEAIYNSPAAAFYVADAGLGGFMTYLANKNLHEAEQDMRDGKMDVGTIARWQKALHDVAFWETLGNAGRGAFLGHASVTIPAMSIGRARPNVGAAGQERDRIDTLLTRAQERAARQDRLSPPPRPQRLTPLDQGEDAIEGPPPRPQLTGPTGGGQAPGTDQGSPPDQGGSSPAAPKSSKSSPRTPKKGASGTKEPPVQGNRRATQEDGTEIFNPDDPTKLNKGMMRGGRVARASGGAVHAGPLTQRADGGRNDTIPTDVESGAYVVPADIVSQALGDGDTAKGYHVLHHMFPPDGPSTQDRVPIMAAGGEYVIPRKHAEAVGRGNLTAGHDALDAWVRTLRRNVIQKLAALPGPARD